MKNCLELMLLSGSNNVQIRQLTIQHILITINDNNPRNINITLSGFTFEIWATLLCVSVQ